MKVLELAIHSPQPSVIDHIRQRLVRDIGAVTLKSTRLPKS